MGPEKAGRSAWIQRGLPLVIALMALAAIWIVRKDLAPDSRNYTLLHEAPPGWKAIDQRPLALFQYSHPEGVMLLVGGVTNVDAKSGASEQKPASAIADELVRSMQDRLPDWSTQRLPDIRAADETFCVIWRTNGQRSVYTAIAVKGNATATITLTCTDRTNHREHPHYEWLEQFLGTLRFVPFRDDRR